MTTRFRGGCMCGAIRYEAEGPATGLCICHCTSCRRAAGAAGVAWGTFARAGFAITQGAPREYRSSSKVLRGFCAACGTSLTYRREDKPDEIDATLASLDNPEALRPAQHLWVEDKLGWVALEDGLPQRARGSEASAARPSGTPETS